jgi:hypothetical protein
MPRLQLALLLAGVVLLLGCPGSGPAVVYRDRSSTINWPESGAPTETGATDWKRPSGEPVPGCSPTCKGCCTPTGSCQAGISPQQCGVSGAACVDCTAQSGICREGVGCCKPACAGKSCGADNGCGGTCDIGSGCTSCTPSCGGKPCGSDDGCKGTCQPGSGCCSSSCGGKKCGEDDGCGKACAIGSGCDPNCGQLLASKNLPDVHQGCCEWGCLTTEAGSTFDCAHCCSSTGPGVCSQPSCGQLLAKKGLPDASMGCCANGCTTTEAGGPGATWDCNHCCSSTQAGVGVCY